MTRFSDAPDPWEMASDRAPVPWPQDAAGETPDDAPWIPVWPSRIGNLRVWVARCCPFCDGAHVFTVRSPYSIYRFPVQRAECSPDRWLQPIVSERCRRRRMTQS